ncbi:PilZ domain-containing protein [Agarilytica rhodophyticola]|uniref:PilZ domain-containing protein n=1 Tax=Agarilytica rhodophyticola TaxID=1737490 RepID=UPI000B3468E6|nr:PilZ domain-containing protein [Agarilytica rhodophyticola]
MEHRKGSRVTIHYPVTVYKNKKKLGTYLTRNISLGGLFLEGCSQKISPDEVLSLEIKPSAKTLANITLSAKAFVIHCSAQGAGLMWIDNNDIFRQPLYDFIRDLSQEKSTR